MSGPSINLASAYQPTGQGTADKNYQALTNSMVPYAQSLPGQVVPFGALGAL